MADNQKESTVSVESALKSHEGKYRCNDMHDNYHYLRIIEDTDDATVEKEIRAEALQTDSAMGYFSGPLLTTEAAASASAALTIDTTVEDNSEMREEDNNPIMESDYEAVPSDNENSDRDDDEEEEDDRDDNFGVEAEGRHSEAAPEEDLARDLGLEVVYGNGGNASGTGILLAANASVSVIGDNVSGNRRGGGGFGDENRNPAVVITDFPDRDLETERRGIASAGSQTPTRRTTTRMTTTNAPKMVAMEGTKTVLLKPDCEPPVVATPSHNLHDAKNNNDVSDVGGRVVGGGGDVNHVDGDDNIVKNTVDDDGEKYIFVVHCYRVQ